MTHVHCPVQRVTQVAENTFVLGFHSAEISKQVLPGQFVNIKPDERTEPLLRRPFSVYRTEGDVVEIVFNVVGKGSSILRQKREGESLDVLGPLGVPFSVSGDDFTTAVLVGGGLGVAPLPLATETLVDTGKQVVTFLGARTASQLVEAHLSNLEIATDDGSKGFRGNVVELLALRWPLLKERNVKVFACGPTAMLRALAQFARTHNIRCEVSLEGPMACGFGICQGCPVELAGSEKRYALMCKDGPVFDVRSILL